MADKYGPRWLVAVGFTISLPCLIFLRFITHDALQQIVLLYVLLALLDISLTLVIDPLMAEIVYVVKAKEKKIPKTFRKGGAYRLYFCWFVKSALIRPI
jgi:hypothetical protein